MSRSKPVAARAARRPSVLVGALLRLCWQDCRARILKALTEHGFTDLTQTHLGVFGWPTPQGVRPVDLAEQTYMTKQALNYVLAQLERRGYLERRTGEDDARRLVYLTAQGQRVVEIMRATMRDVEAEWAQRVGRRKFDEFLAMLQVFSKTE